SDYVNRYLGQKGYKPILLSSLVGMTLPVCCLGSLPIAVMLRKKGARLGPILAFLVATPATSISAVIVSLQLFGLHFTLYISAAVLITASILGIITDGIEISEPNQKGAGEGEKKSCCHDATDGHSQAPGPKEETKNSWKKALQYGFVTLPKSIGFEIIVGLLLASFISTFPPIQHFIRDYLTDAVGYIFIWILGLLTYVCSTASVPLADAFVHSGMSVGQALCYLIIGPVTSYGTLLVVKKEFGGRVFAIYIVVISSFAILSGILYDLILIP
ncbi:MAG: permease, partial [Candidatus Omnitrophica bacterium]|nr:permease [Candidatus Omnitrophota bacterium]